MEVREETRGKMSLECEGGSKVGLLLIDEEEKKDLLQAAANGQLR